LNGLSNSFGKAAPAIKFTGKIKAGLFFSVLFYFFMQSQDGMHTALAFHFGGVGACDGCHSMHDAKDSDAGNEGRSESLLLASDPSSVCLNCHGGPGGPDRASVFSMDGSAMTPGGDFYWLTKTFTWPEGVSSGDSHGHNVIARDFNLGEDLRLTLAPGGSYPAAILGCTSCHDPHGRSDGGTRGGAPPVSVSGSYGEQPAQDTIRGNYRLLGGVQYEGGGDAEGFSFVFDAPVARQNILNRFGETDSSHVDYGIGMSEWCGNCHEGILRDEHSGGGSFEHPSGSTVSFGSGQVSMYNSYISTGNLLEIPGGSGTADTAYLQFVPFERGTGNPDQLDPTSTRGPNSNSRVMCLTCHRAHASAFQSSGRWDLDAALLAESHPGPGDGGVSGNDVLHSYYGRNIAVEFGSEQGPFCEKCHGLTMETLAEPTQEQMLDPTVEPLMQPFQDPLLQDPLQP
jgi:hypothetical protein